MPVISLENCRRGRGRERSERLPRAPSSSSSPGGRARWPWRRWVLSDKSQLAPCLTALARREPGGGSAWQELGTSARAPCSGGEGRADSCQPEPQTVPGLGFFLGQELAFGVEKRGGNEMGSWWWSLPKEQQGCALPAAGEHPLGVQGNPRAPSPVQPQNWARSSRTLPPPAHLQHFGSSCDILAGKAQK